MTVDELIKKLLKARELGYGEVAVSIETPANFFSITGTTWKATGIFLCEDGDLLADEYTPEKHVTLLTTP